MKTSETVAEIAKAIHSIQSELPTIKKNKQGYGYKYATLSSIIETITPICCKNKLAIIQSVGTEDDLIRITTRLQHESGEFFEDSMLLAPTAMKSKQGKDTLTPPQEMGVSITYGRRYAISAMLNIATDEDTDGTLKQLPAQTQKFSKPQSNPPASKPDKFRNITNDELHHLIKMSIANGFTPEGIKESLNQMGCQVTKVTKSMTIDDLNPVLNFESYETLISKIMEGRNGIIE